MLITSSNSSGSDSPVTITSFPMMFTAWKFGLTMTGINLLVLAPREAIATARPRFGCP